MPHLRLAKFDYLIVGAGLFGCVFARVVAEAGHRVMIVDRRKHIAGNCYTESIHGIQVHRYGPHIFHTSNSRVWNFVNRFAEFHPYIHRSVVRYNDQLLSFPINLMTFHQLWGVTTPAEVEARLHVERIPCDSPRNCEQWILSQVGRELYEIFFRGYTTKQWNRDPSELPASIVRRIPIRMTYNDRYFNDVYEGIPVGGYTRLFENMLDHDNIEIETDVDFLEFQTGLIKSADKIVYTGRIDEYFGFSLGRLEYRSLRFEDAVVDGDYQGTSIVNYPQASVPFTRITEHKHFENAGSLPTSVITREYPQDYDEQKIPYYPVRDEANAALYEQYREMAKSSNVIFGGRLGTYQYYDMHQVIAQAITKAEEELGSRVLQSESFRKAA